MAQSQRPRESWRNRKNKSPNHTQYPINSFFSFQIEQKTKQVHYSHLALLSPLNYPNTRQIAAKSSKWSRIKTCPDKSDTALRKHLLPSYQLNNTDLIMFESHNAFPLPKDIKNIFLMQCCQLGWFFFFFFEQSGESLQTLYLICSFNLIFSRLTQFKINLPTIKQLCSFI